MKFSGSNIHNEIRVYRFETTQRRFTALWWEIWFFEQNWQKMSFGWFSAFIFETWEIEFQKTQNSIFYFRYLKNRESLFWYSDDAKIISAKMDTKLKFFYWSILFKYFLPNFRSWKSTRWEYFIMKHKVNNYSWFLSEKLKQNWNTKLKIEE